MTIFLGQIYLENNYVWFNREFPKETMPYIDNIPIRIDVHNNMDLSGKFLSL